MLEDTLLTLRASMLRERRKQHYTKCQGVVQSSQIIPRYFLSSHAILYSRANTQSSGFINLLLPNSQSKFFYQTLRPPNVRIQIFDTNSQSALSQSESPSKSEASSSLYVTNSNFPSTFSAIASLMIASSLSFRALSREAHMTES
jgi:hypothetical protein